MTSRPAQPWRAFQITQQQWQLPGSFHPTSSSLPRLACSHPPSRPGSLRRGLLWNRFFPVCVATKSTMKTRRLLGMLAVFLAWGHFMAIWDPSEGTGM